MEDRRSSSTSSPVRRRLSCRLSLFRRDSKHNEERPKSRKLLEGPDFSPRYLDIFEVTQVKIPILDLSEPIIGELADGLDSRALRMVMATAERRRDVERRRSIAQLGSRLAHLSRRQSPKQSVVGSDTESLTQDLHVALEFGPSRPVSVKNALEIHISPRPNAVTFMNTEYQKTSRPASMKYSSRSSQDTTASTLHSRGSSRHSSILFRNSDPQTSRPASFTLRSSDPQTPPGPASILIRASDVQISSRPASMTNSILESRAASKPVVEVGIRVGEFDPKLRKPYIYSPLQSDRVIRLLSLRQPSVDCYKGDFYYQVMIMSLDDPVPYETVSYTWGDCDRNCRLNFVDGSFLPITENLASSLLEISSHCETGYLFVDQVCIDPLDLAERNYQTKIAGDITRRASRMLVSLSLPPASVGNLSPLIDLATQYESNRKSVVALQWAMAPLLRFNRSDCSLNSIHWRSLVDLLNHPWFMRAWVFQEVVLSESVYFIFGQRLVHFDTLVHLALATSRMEAETEVLPAEGVTTQPGFQRLYSMVKQRSDRKLFGQTADFWQLVSDTAPHSQTSDDRDSLYALLGFQEDTSIKIEPNYRIARHDVFIDAAKCFIEGKFNLDILSFVPRSGRTESREEGVPSWVPDWKQPGEIMPLISTSRSSPFKASENRMHLVPVQSKTYRPIRLLSSRLTTRGRVIAKVADAKIEPFSDSGPWMGRDLHDFLRLEELISYFEHSDACIPDEKSYTRERVLRVLLADGALLIDTPEFSKGVYLSDAELAELAQAYRHFDSQDPFDSSRFQLASYAQNLHTLRSLSRIALGRRLFLSEDGRLGIAHQSIEAGDLICVLHGSKTPIVLQIRSDGRYETKGQCYFEDAMYGEAMVWDEDDAEEFVLV